MIEIPLVISTNKTLDRFWWNFEGVGGSRVNFVYRL